MSLHLDENAGVRLAIEGCGHGTLHAIYASVAAACNLKGWPGVDLLIIGGDFQAVRNGYDLNCVSMPAKYREMCDFHEYYSGQRTAPYLTIFVGGNHEASNYLFELYYGGWVAPNIYYMGAANVLRLGPLRIAGMSGIWKGYSYRKPHHERLPYNESDMRSIYHVRELDVRKLLQIRSQVDIGISHDWPKGIEWKGDWKQLFRFKKHLEEDARNKQLGSVAAQQVLTWLRPKWWFSAHLHCKYAAVVDHERKDGPEHRPSNSSANPVPTKNEDEIDLEDETRAADGTLPANADEMDLELESNAPSRVPETKGQVFNAVDIEPEPNLEEARAALPKSFRRSPTPEPVRPPPEISNSTTAFLALDKCLPGKHFLQLMTIPTESSSVGMRPLKLEYDREWFAITRTFALDEPIALGDLDAAVPRPMKPAQYEDMIDKRRLWIDDNIEDSDLTVPDNFEITAPVYDGGDWNLPQYSQVREYPNSQTARFCKMLEIPNPFDISDDDINRRLASGPRSDPDAERFDGGRRRGGFAHGRGRGGGRDRGRGRGHRRFRGR